MIAALDRLAVWWLDRHCRRWQYDSSRTDAGPPCVVEAYQRARHHDDATTVAHAG